MTEAHIIEKIYYELRPLFSIGGKVYTEYELINHLKNKHFFQEEDSSDFALFKKHFLVMHALYTIQKEIAESRQGILSINALRIELLPWLDHADGSTVSAEYTSQSLRDYYLDIHNLAKESKETVDELLTGFWNKYARHTLFSDQEITNAAKMVGVILPCSQAHIKKSYREKASMIHPDKGGDHNAFIQLKNAYDLLMEMKT